MSVVGLDYPAVKLVAETLKVKWTDELFCKIKLLEAWYLNHIRIKEKASGSADKNRYKRKRTS